MVCKNRNCNRITHLREGLCPKHLASPKPQTRAQKYPWHKLYKTAKWLKLRKKKLATNPLCELCKQPGNEIDHIFDHKGDVVLFYEWLNLQTLCKPCHSRKTMLTNYIKRLPQGFRTLTIVNGPSRLESIAETFEMGLYLPETIDLAVRDILAENSKKNTINIKFSENTLKNVIIIIDNLQKALKEKFGKIIIKEETWKHILDKE